MMKIQNSEFRIQREVSLRGTKRRGSPGKIQNLAREWCLGEGRLWNRSFGLEIKKNTTRTRPKLTSFLQNAKNVSSEQIRVDFYMDCFATLAMTLHAIAKSPFYGRRGNLFCSTWYSFFEFLVTMCVAW